MSRIAFVSTLHGCAWGGSEELWSRAGLALARTGVEVLANVCSWPGETPRLNALQGSGIEVTRRRWYGRLPDSLSHRLRERSARQWLARARPDHVVLSQSGAFQGMEWPAACVDGGIPYSIVIQAVDDHVWPDDPASAQFASLYEHARSVMFVSEANRDLVRNQLGSALTNATVVRNPVNVPTGTAPPWPSEENGIRLACVGRLEPQAKGQDIVVDVLAQEKWRNREVTVSLFGSGANEELIRRLIRLKNAANVEIRGHTANVAEIWSAHHALLLPSRYEGLPLVVVEAMLSARPCVVTDVAGNAELLQDNVTGFIAHAPSAKYVDEALERAWNARANWKRMGELAATAVRDVIPADPVEEFIKKCLCEP